MESRMPKSITHQNNKTMETKVQVEMTAEQAEAFKQFQEKQAKEEAAKKRKELWRGDKHQVECAEND